MFILLNSTTFSGARAMETHDSIMEIPWIGVDECWVITTNYFTNPTINLAESNAVKLIDRDQLIDWISLSSLN